ncbi:hypothetical protein P280DRAFT_466367 [Massarina eburnea CBS 473.64]|uniref:Uncharacterized protein n=1 Tax=Massarina eburnea CBS 473.64 TaxID=1395130 RepID=A0A6A6SD98_9PLEO|nr:hypothetical protein P280DRAFT_466367 [Massarina eburnea CBS 473.64]
MNWAGLGWTGLGWVGWVGLDWIARSALHRTTTVVMKPAQLLASLSIYLSIYLPDEQES